MFSFVIRIRIWLISGCCQKLQVGVVGPDFVLPWGSHSASRQLEPIVLIEAFLSRGHVHMDDLLEGELSGVSDRVNSCGLLFDGELILQCMFS